MKAYAPIGIWKLCTQTKRRCFNQDNNQTTIYNNAVNRAVFNTIALNILTHEFKDDTTKEIKTNQILFRGHFKQFLKNHRI